MIRRLDFAIGLVAIGVFAMDAGPGDLALAVHVARLCIEKARRDGDPRYLGYAEAALIPWWSTPDPPVPVLLMQATILQSTHAFEPALAALQQALHTDPDNAQAWLTQATILQVQGRYAEAAKSCASPAQPCMRKPASPNWPD